MPLVDKRIAAMARQYGFSLLEVLVAVVIISVGLLGVSALNLTSNQLNYGGYLRTQASYLATDISEKMQLNTDQALNNAYDIDADDTLPTSAPAVDCGVATNNCTPAQLAVYELFNWTDQLLRKLPQGDATISTDTTVNPARATITIQWNDSGQEDPTTEELIFDL